MLNNGKISNFAQVAGIRRYVLTEGVGKGIDVIDCNSGRLRFLVNVSKACDIMQAYYEGQNLSFVSKNGFTKRELPFLKRFEGGMLYTAGLDSLGGREGYEIHGSFHNTPAEIISAKCGENGVEIVAEIKDAALFGKNLVLRRRIYSALNGDALSVEDTLVNAGYADENFCLLYHVNVGYPLLDAGGKIIADVKKCVPRTPRAKEKQADAFITEDDEPNAEETCYFLTLASPEISYINEKSGKKFTVRYSGETLPHLVEWKSTASGDYALGIEPCTSELDEKFAYKSIKAGEEIKFRIEMQVEKL